MRPTALPPSLFVLVFTSACASAGPTPLPPLPPQSEVATIEIVSIDPPSGSLLTRDTVLTATLAYSITPKLDRKYLIFSQFAARSAPVARQPAETKEVTDARGTVTLQVRLTDSLRGGIDHPPSLRFVLLRVNEPRRGAALVLATTEEVPFAEAAGDQATSLVMHVPLRASLDATIGKPPNVAGNVSFVDGAALIEGPVGALRLNGPSLSNRVYALSVWLKRAPSPRSSRGAGATPPRWSVRDALPVLRSAPAIADKIPLRDVWTHVVLQRTVERHELWIDGELVAAVDRPLPRRRDVRKGEVIDGVGGGVVGGVVGGVIGGKPAEPPPTVPWMARDVRVYMRPLAESEIAALRR